MYYDKTIFDENDIKSLDAMINKETTAEYNFNFDSAGGWKLGSWYYGAGLHVFGELGDSLEAGCDWNSETGVAVTNYLITMLNNPKVGNGLVCEEKAATHDLGAWFDGAWNYDKYKEALGDDLGMAPIPTYTLNGAEVQLKGFYGSKAIGVNAKAENPAAAVAFAAFLGSEAQQIARFEKSAQIPTNINAGATEAVQSDALAAVIVAEANNCSVAQPTSPVFGGIYWTYADTIPTKIKTGELTADNAQQFMDDLVAAMTGTN
jgi:arabinogalactan oligomer/maltooligosaccharide transport system substrate-binding protein